MNMQATLLVNSTPYQDRFGRSPWLLAACVGDLKKAELLWSSGVDLNDKDRMGDTALMNCCAHGHAEMATWLIQMGADIEAANDAGDTALILAAQAGKTDCVRALLQAGAVANRSNQYEQAAILMAANEEIVRLLIEAGADIGGISTEMKRILLGLEDRPTLEVSQAEFASGRDRRFGMSNPEIMDIPFWNEMVRAGVSAYHARMQFSPADRFGQPVWCFSRFGMSFTEFPDGRFVQIGGEHEDLYDPDFCIYNEVVFHERNGRFQIMGYPQSVFPPADFHSATYVGGFIYIIGRLGYHGDRAFGSTPVYRLNCRTWRMESLPTTGSNPGWIFEHKASVEGTNALVISGGKICEAGEGQEQTIENKGTFRLDLCSMKWSRL
jgi:hypothetical protein